MNTKTWLQFQCSRFQALRQLKEIKILLERLFESYLDGEDIDGLRKCKLRLPLNVLTFVPIFFSIVTVMYRCSGLLGSLFLISCSNIMHTLFIIFFIFLYMFRTIPCSSSGGSIVYTQHLVLCMSLFLGDRSVHCLCTERSPKKSDIQRTRCCVCTKILLMMSKILFETCKRNIKKICNKQRVH